MKIPKEVIRAASWFVERTGLRFKHLGKYKDAEVFMYMFPDGAETGYPYLYLYNENKTTEEITGEKAVDILVSMGVE